MSTKATALAMYLGSILCWSISPILIRYIKDFYPVLLLIFLRYFVSLLVLWPFYFLSVDKDSRRRNFRLLPSLLPRLLLIALLNYIFQISFTSALYLIYPGFATLIYQSGIIFSVFLAVFFFPDERKTLKSYRFQLGLICAVAGVILTILGGKNLGKMQFNLGVALILLSTASWALLGALLKRLGPFISPTFAASTVFTMVTPLYFLTYLAICGGLSVPEAPNHIWIILICSGFIGVGIGQSLHYRSVHVLGISLVSSLGLLIPLLVGIASFFVFGELLSYLQLVGGVLLLSGSYLVIRIRFRHIS